MQSTLLTPKSFTVQSETPEGLHVAIIMDGNGRWATQRGLPRVLGHGAGGAAARRVIELLARMRRFGGVAAAARECPVQSVGGAR